MKIDDLKDHQCLLYLHQTQAVTWKYQENRQEKELALKGHINLQDTESLKNAALEGFGIVPFILLRNIYHLKCDYSSNYCRKIGKIVQTGND